MIPNISDYFRSQQQHRAALAENARQFDEAKAQRDQQFYTNLFASPLMGLGTGLLGKYATEQMPNAVTNRAAIEANTDATKKNTGWNQVGRGLLYGLGSFVNMLGDDPVSPVPPKPAAVPGRQGLSIEPTPSLDKDDPYGRIFRGMPVFGRK